MTQILVDPPSVEAYGETAKGLFKAVSTELTNLVDNAFGVPFEGKNAAEFKSDVGRLAVSFAQQTHQSMQAMSRMVHSATLSIASSLGGSTVNIPIEAPDLAPPAASSTRWSRWTPSGSSSSATR